jgi:hypothetical protein
MEKGVDRKEIATVWPLGQLCTTLHSVCHKRRIINSYHDLLPMHTSTRCRETVTTSFKTKANRISKSDILQGIVTILVISGLESVNIKSDKLIHFL